MTPEFSHPIRIDTIGDEPRTIALAADVDQRRRVAGRFGLVAVDDLSATFTIRRAAGSICADGRVNATVTQACAITGDPLPASIDEAVTLHFVEAAGSPDEIELSSDALDTIEIENGAIDLGEAAAETMALALDPYPRGPDAAQALAAAGVKQEEEAGAFGALAGLKDSLHRRNKT